MTVREKETARVGEIDLRKGLSEEEVKRSREKHGANVLTKQKQRGFWRRFLSNLGDPVSCFCSFATVTS